MAASLGLIAGFIMVSTAGCACQFAQSRATPEPDAGETRSGRRDGPLRRENAFFGVHFDLHPGKTDTALGADVSEENIEHLLTRVRPDWIQYDCKGHAGYTGYPSQVGWPSPGIVKDSLAIWRKTTAKHGVTLFIHYSGLWDRVAVEHHPEWARVTEDGKPDPNIASVFGPYVDKLMIPQLQEVVAAYGLDGVWVDGECWAARPDYSPAALKAWRSETGRSDAPRSASDPAWLEWKMFHRRAFERYVCHWVDALHAFDPKLQVTSNWMYTTFAPKPIVAKLDFLSGDFVPSGAVDRARLDARYLSSTGRPWDLLAWGFVGGEGRNPSMKTAIQLQAEAAIVLSQGGAFQVYYQPTRPGYVSEGIIDTLGQVADFCRARQDVCHKSTTVGQIALLLSSESQFDRSDAVFHPAGSLYELEGALHALLELHYSVDVLAEHQLMPRLQNYPVVVIADAHRLADDVKEALRQYVHRGGKLLLLGEKCARLFTALLRVRLDGPPRTWEGELQSSAGLVNVKGVWQQVTPTTARVVGYRYATRDTRKPGQVAATIASHGKGQVAAVYGPVALQMYETHHPYLRRFVADVARQLVPDPIVDVDGPPTVDVALRRTRDGRLALHLVNLNNQPLGNRQVVDLIPAAGPIQVRWRLPAKPGRVQWLPSGERVTWSWSDGVLLVTVPRLAIHGAIVVEP
ncbi:MAG: hypothetical protein JSV19_08485 [Phycisphaerales bacterium]|nr:MAG: hypothetical protein JSV19_08485 [Phycisphaerales bacterium]